MPRELAAAHREDAAVRKGLAAGLVNTLNAANTENDLARRDVLLNELRALARAHREDQGVRENLTLALFNTLVDAKAEDDLSRRDALLDELRTLLANHPDYEFVQEVWRRVTKAMSAEDNLL